MIGGYLSPSRGGGTTTTISASGGVVSGSIGDGVIFSGNIASGQVGTIHLADGSILTIDIASGAIQSGQIGSGAVLGQAGGGAFCVASGTLAGFELGSGSIVSGRIASGQLGGNHIANGGLISGNFASGNVARQHLASGLLQNSLQFIIGGGALAIASSYVGDMQVPFNCLLTSITILSDQAGTARLGIWKDSLANFPTTSGDTITTSGVPLLSGGQKTTYSGTAALSGWITAFNAGDILSVVVLSGATLTRATVAMQVGIGD